MRHLLAAGPPAVAPAFANAARSRLRYTNTKVLPNPYSLFRRQPHNVKFTAPTELLHDTLANVRSLYGAGMGFRSLVILASIVRATLGLQWEEEGDMADILAVIDIDIGQAIQVSIHFLFFFCGRRGLMGVILPEFERRGGGRPSS